MLFQCTFTAVEGKKKAILSVVVGLMTLFEKWIPKELRFFYFFSEGELGCVIDSNRILNILVSLSEF